MNALITIFDTRFSSTGAILQVFLALLPLHLVRLVKSFFAFPSFLARYIGTHVAIVIVHSRLTPLYKSCALREHWRANDNGQKKIAAGRRLRHYKNT